MTAPTPDVAQHDPHQQHQFTDSDGRTWRLEHDFLDFHLDGWEWDGHPYDPAAGPWLHSVRDSAQRELLLALVVCSGLWQVPLSAPQDLAHVLDPMDACFQRLSLGVVGPVTA